MEEGADHVSLGMVGDGKRCVREDEEEDVEEKGLDFGLDHHHYQQTQKLTRTDSFPFRAVSSDVLLTTDAHLPPLYPSSGININDGGPTAGGIYSCSGFDVGARPTWLQPYGSINGSNNYLKSQGIMGNNGLTNVRYPIFTSAQWQELKRQALIYKHFVSSVPIPPDLLLFDPTRSFPTIPPLYPNHGRGSVGGGGYFNLRFTNNTDPEPGRCRRTDGKKWRCSREVAPDHKYCERHMHRSRPRSRKPVEQQRQKTTTTEHIADISTTTITTAATGAGVGSETIGNKPPIIAKALEKEPRYLEWMRGGFDMLHANNTSNHNMIGLRTSSPTPLSLNQYEEHLKVNHSDQNDPCYSFLRDDLSPGETNNHDHTREYPPRSFIDAWSNEKPPLRQTMSMSSTAGEDFSTHQIQMGLGLERSHSLSWMNPLPSPLGGPLAEVLHKSSTTTSSPRSDDGDGEITRSHAAGLINPTGRNCCDSAKDNPLRVVVSSPTGVLQRTFLSLSDSSSNSSPTFAARSGRSEIGSQWICDNK